MARIISRMKPGKEASTWQIASIGLRAPIAGKAGLSRREAETTFLRYRLTETLAREQQVSTKPKAGDEKPVIPSILNHECDKRNVMRNIAFVQTKSQVELKLGLIHGSPFSRGPLTTPFFASFTFTPGFRVGDANVPAVVIERSISGGA